MSRLERIRAKIARLQEIEERLAMEEYRKIPHKPDFLARALFCRMAESSESSDELSAKVDLLCQMVRAPGGTVNSIDGHLLDIEILRGGGK